MPPQSRDDQKKPSLNRVKQMFYLVNPGNVGPVIAYIHLIHKRLTCNNSEYHDRNELWHIKLIVNKRS